MKFAMKYRNKLIMAAVAAPLLILFAYTALRSGPLSPVAVTVTAVEQRPIAPSLFGIGIVEARYTHRIGPTTAGRLKQVSVQVGDTVRAGQLLGEMDPVDLEARISAQSAALLSAQAGIRSARAQVQDALARKSYTASQAARYARLFEEHVASAETLEARRQEQEIAEAAYNAAKANLDAALNELERAASERDALIRQRSNLRLIAPVDGLITMRNADPGSTVVAGQSVVEMVDPGSLWINARFDQISSNGLAAGLSAKIGLRSQAGTLIEGQVLRVEPLADAVTEELLAKVVFTSTPKTAPPIGELAEITIALPELPASPVVPNASLIRQDGQTGVWVFEEDGLQFTPVKTGGHDLDGRMQVLEGLKPGQQVVVYSQRALDRGSRVRVVEHIPGVRS